MKFSAQEDLKLPQAEVFARLSNFETFERIAIKAMFAFRRFRKATRTKIP
jgi:carbon monoxide dehydrogenase subunit G